MSMVCTLYSGSSGNSTYIGNSLGGILVDIGCSHKRTAESLASVGISINTVRGVFITHEHADHVMGLNIFQKNHPSVPIFATEKTMSSLLKSRILKETDSLHTVSESGDEIDGMLVTAFHTPHDSAESCGYTVCAGDKKIAGIATDLGTVTDEVRENLYGCESVIIESNYDKAMLTTGRYPYYLKMRIMSDCGHLSNYDCAEFLPSLFHMGTKRFVLAHLSAENNLPEIAEQNAVNTLGAYGVEPDSYILISAPRSMVSKPLFF